VCEEPVRVTGAGMVTSVNRNTLSFTIHATQYTTGGECSDEMVVRVRMDLNPKWTNPAQRLPHPPAVVGFLGVLHQFENYRPPNSTRQVICVVVALDDITYLPRASATHSSPQTKQTIHTKLKSRAEKYALEASTLSSLTPQNILGKRKAETSDEEVNEAVQPQAET